MTTQTLGVEGIQTLRAEDPAYRLREVDQTAPAGMWQVDAQGGDLLFRSATAADWSGFTDVVTLASTPAVTIHGTLTVSGTIEFAANIRLDDDVLVLFGDDSDYYLGYSATDDALEMGRGALVTQNVALLLDASGDITFGGDLLQVGNAASEWTDGALVVAYDATTNVTFSTTGLGSDAILNLVVTEGGLGNAMILFRQGDGSGTTDNMMYLVGYEGNAGYLRCQTRDSGTTPQNTDVWRIPDGQIEIWAQSTWENNAYDDYDDAAVLSPYRDGKLALAARQDELIDMGVLRQFEDGWIGHNDQRFGALLAGGIYQTRDRVDAAVARIEDIEVELAAMRGALA